MTVFAHPELTGINAGHARPGKDAGIHQPGLMLVELWKREPFMTSSSPHKLGVVRVAIAAAASSVAFYLFCWIGALLPIGPATHMYLQLFTNAQAVSTAALAVGLCWSLAFGLIAGALFALFYNLFSSLDR